MQSDLNILERINKTVDKLSEPQSYDQVCHEHRLGEPLPSTEKLAKIVNMLREILFPGYFGNTSLRPNTIKHYMGVYVDELFELLSEQILAGLCFTCENPEEVDFQERSRYAQSVASDFISFLPEIRRKLVTSGDKADVQDVQFDDLSKLYHFGISVFDNSQINHLYHDETLILKFK